MHDSVMSWVGAEVAAHGLSGKTTLEVGSLDVNGSVRGMFTGPYTGVDIRPGRGVDRVVNAGSPLPFLAGSFEVVITTETLEHDPLFWVTLREIGRVLSVGGHLILTTRGNGFGEHHEPSDYWRFMPESRRLIASLAECDPIALALDPEVPGVFVHAIRR